MELDREFVRLYAGTPAILSPRACTGGSEQLERHAQQLRSAGGRLLFDPQFYQPRTDKPTIMDYPYWAPGEFTTSEFQPADFSRKVIAYQRDVLGTDEIILPGRFTNIADEPCRRT